jgi:hypothetical protein
MVCKSGGVNGSAMEIQCHHDVKTKLSSVNSAVVGTISGVKRTCIGLGAITFQINIFTGGGWVKLTLPITLLRSGCHCSRLFRPHDVEH